MDAWLNTQIGADAASVVSYIVMCITLFAIAWLCLTFFRRLKSRALHMVGKKRSIRLSVRDAATIDTQRRVILIRRDNVEHLILVGGPSDMVIERNINVPETKSHAEPICLPSAEEKPAVKAKHTPQTEGTVEAPTQPVLMKEEKKQKKEQHIIAPEPAAMVAQSTNTPAVPQAATATAQQQAPIPQPAPAPTAHTVPAPTPAINVEAGQPIQHALPKNVVPPLKVNRQPATPQVQLHQHRSPYFAGNRQAVQKQPVSQPAANQTSTHQQQAVSASGSRQQPHTAINLQTPSARTMRQNGITPRPITTAQRTNGTNGYTSPHPSNPNQQVTGTNTVAATITPNNTAGDNVHTRSSDLASLVTGNAVNKPMNTQRESATDALRARQETSLRAVNRTGEEDFEKILQEELIRAQANMKRSSSNEN